MNTVKLGNYAHISISVRSIKESAAFYEKLGFTHLFGNPEPHAWALFTDGMVNLHLYEFHFPSPALHYFSEHMGDKALELLRLGVKAEQQKSRDGHRTQHTIHDPNEVAVMLMHHSDADMPRPDGTPHSVLGMFGELSICADSARESLEFWTKLSFGQIAGSERPYPWVTISDGVMTLGLHQTTAFTVPSLTYFTEDVRGKIAELEHASLPVERILKDPNEQPAGAILTAPEGQLIFLLQDRTAKEHTLAKEDDVESH